MSVKAGASAGPKVAEAPLPTSHPGPGGLSGGGLAWAFVDNGSAEIGKGAQMRPWSGKSAQMHPWSGKSAQMRPWSGKSKDTASPRLKG